MSLHLLDIVDLNALQEFQDTFAEVAQIGAVVMDMQGGHLTKACRFTKFCAMMRGNARTQAHCRASAAALGAEARQERRPVQRPCPNLGLADGSVPIVINGEQIASWMIGQCVVHHLPADEVRGFARDNGLDQEAVLQAYNDIPVISPEQFNRALKLLSLFADNLSEVCYKNYQLQQAAVEKERVTRTLDTVVSNVSSAIYVFDPANQEVVYANRAARERFEGGAETGGNDGAGLKCHKLMFGRKTPCDFCRRSDLFAPDGTPRRRTNVWEFHDEKSGGDYEVGDSLVHWHDGRLLQMSVVRDITARRALLAAEAANTAKRDFLSHMSHELRTPLNGVLGMTYLALQAEPPPRQREYLQKIQSSADILLGVINDVLDFSKIEAGKLELSEQPFSLRTMVHTLRDMLQQRVEEKGLSLRIDLQPSLPDRLLADSLRLSQVLMNLMGNAVKFTNEGYVQLSLEHGEVEVGGRFNLLCRVSDSGIGMTPEQSARLFNPFVQADSSISRQFGGTGLGLTISKKLLELMGGGISLESAPGRGTTFSFQIPVRLAAQGRTADARAEEPENADFSLRGMRILLAEDNEINQEIVRSILEDMGARVSTAADGLQAVEAFSADEFDLILMDIQMPLMDGYEATRRIRASSRPEGAGIPIVAMTANAMREDQEKSLAAGMDDHISKPLEIAELRRVLARFPAR